MTTRVPHPDPRIKGKNLNSLNEVFFAGGWGGGELRGGGGNRSFRKAGGLTEVSPLQPPPHGASKSIIRVYFRATSDSEIGPRKAPVQSSRVLALCSCSLRSPSRARQHLLPPISWLNARISGFLPSSKNNNTNPTQENQRAQLKEQKTVSQSETGRAGGLDT